MKKEYNIMDVYPNSQLIEVVCEIRFFTNLSVECQRDKYYEEIKNKYPLIIVPNNQQLQDISLNIYRFENGEKSKGIGISADRFFYYEKEYEGHIKFIKEFIKISKIFCNLYNIKNIKKLGWRYINIIPFVRENDFIPLERFLNIGIKLPNTMNENYSNVNIGFVTKIDNNTISTRVESLIDTIKKQEALLLDLDFNMTKKLDYSKINEYLENAHLKTRELFEQIITNDYRNYLKGDKI